MKQKKILVTYFSYTGNTKHIAEQVAQQLSADIISLELLEPYSDDYDQVVVQGEAEVQDDFRPKLKNLAIDPSSYDTLVLCSPIWWYTVAPAIKSFLDQYDWAGKTIFPIITNGGYGLGHSLEDIRQLCPQAKLSSCLECVFEDTTMQTPEEELTNYIKNLQPLLNKD